MRSALKAMGWLVGIAVAAVALLFGINATDEELSEQARAALQVPAPPPPIENNGFIDFLVLGAPAEAPTYATGLKALASYGDPKAMTGDMHRSISLSGRVRECLRGGYLACAASSPSRLTQALDSHAALLSRYRAMRKKPEFVDLFGDLDLATPIPFVGNGAEGSRLSLASAALQFNSGKHESAIAELQAEYDFHRRVAAGSRTLIPKFWAYARLDGAGLFATEIARELPRRERALWVRLEKLVRAPTKDELDITPAWHRIIADTVRRMSTRQHVRLSDLEYELLKSLEDGRTRPWWDAVSPWLYRPHYSVNRYVAKAKMLEQIGALDPKDFLAALPEHRARAAAAAPGVLERWVLSPAGHDHLQFSYYDPSGYFGRMHGHAAVQALTALQVRLRAAGITEADDVARALAGALGQAHANPFTGAPMEFDRERMTIGFRCEREYLTGTAWDLLTKSGRVEIAL